MVPALLGLGEAVELRIERPRLIRLPPPCVPVLPPPGPDAVAAVAIGIALFPPPPGVPGPYPLETGPWRAPVLTEMPVREARELLDRMPGLWRCQASC